MPTFTQPMQRRLNYFEREYDVAPQRQEEEEGFFGRRGFLGNIKNYYQTENWGDWWRGLFGQGEEEERTSKPRYSVSPEWGEQNIRLLQDIMRED